MSLHAVNKVKELEELAELVSMLHSEDRKIVHCHGVFDLMHIGHIQHLQEAKKFGDVLVVTITPDEYVNKGPHRPVFTQELRAESLAALDCVDYVAVNNWPLAIETIRLLRPNFYVKGLEYQDKNNDRTGGIALEEDAVKSVGGELIFTNGVVYSSSRLINQHLPIFSKEVKDYLSHFKKKYTDGGILDYLESARDLKVLVVGDAIIDEYQYCEAIGKSSKEPMLAVKHRNTEKFAGGILAVGNHVANLCDNVRLFTLLGEQNSQEEFVRGKLNPKINATFVYKKNAPTTVKRRFVENYFFTKMMEMYEINDEELQQKENEHFCDVLAQLLPGQDAVIMVDFGHGMMSRDAIELVCAQSRYLALNVQSNAGNMGYHTISKYPRADYICMTENELRLETRDRRGDIKNMVLSVAQKMNCENIVVTRGKCGALCYRKNEGFFQTPALAGQVVDRMGAGDAFLSVSALLAAQNAPMELVGFSGNAAGAHAVATVGHRHSLERVQLIKHIECLLK